MPPAVRARHSTASEIAAGIRREKHQHLLRALRHVDGQAVAARRPSPGLAQKKPFLRRRIGRSAQKSRHHQVMRGLGRRQIHLDPQPIAGRKIGDLRLPAGYCAPRVTLTWSIGPARSKGAGSAWAVVASQIGKRTVRNREMLSIRLTG